MEHYLVLRIIHSAVAVLLLLGVLAHIFMLWKANRGGDKAVFERKLKRTRLISLPVLSVFALSLPLTGGLMASWAGLNLGQTWLLGSSILFAVLVIVVLLLSGRLAKWQALAGAPAPACVSRLSGLYSVLIVVLLLAIFALMGAKPL